METAREREWRLMALEMAAWFGEMWAGHLPLAHLSKDDWRTYARDLLSENLAGRRQVVRDALFEAFAIGASGDQVIPQTLGLPDEQKRQSAADLLAQREG